MTKRKACKDEKSPLKVRKFNDNEIETEEGTSIKPSSTKEQYLKGIKTALREFIKLNNENKFTTQFVWTTNAIEIFFHFTQTSDINYVFAAHALEAITNIYAMSVDSLYEDTIRVNSALGSKALRKRDKVPQHEQEVGDVTKRQLRAPKRRNTIVKNPESLNNKLITNALIDPFFNKINKSIGRIGNPDQMMMNILTNTSSLMKPQAKFWISRDFQGIADETTSHATNETIRIRMDTDIQNCFVRPSHFDFSDENENESDDGQKLLDHLDSDYEMRSDPNNDNEPPLTNESGYETFIENTQTFSHDCQNFFDLSDRNEELVVDQPGSPLEQAADTDVMMSIDSEPNVMLSSFIETPQENSFLEPQSVFLKPPKLLKRAIKRKNHVSLIFLKNFKNCLLPADDKYTLHVKMFKRIRLIPPTIDIAANIFDKFLHSSLALSDPVRGIELSLSDKIVQDSSGYESYQEECKSDSDDSDHSDDSIITVIPKASTTLFLSPGKSSEKVISPLSSFFLPRNFSMSSIRQISINIIKQESKSGKEEVKFSKLNCEVAKACKESSQSSSCAVTFLGVLQFASAAKITLHPDSTIDDFSIKFNSD